MYLFCVYFFKYNFLKEVFNKSVPRFSLKYRYFYSSMYEEKSAPINGDHYVCVVLYLVWAAAVAFLSLTPGWGWLLAAPLHAAVSQNSSGF